jgi:hypothetical protein
MVAKEMKSLITLIAFGLALITNVVWQWAVDAGKEATPTSEWFVVRKINVATAKQGDNPSVVYDREIKKPFTGDWIVEIVRTKDEFTICTGSGTNRYEPKDALPKAGVDLIWLVGKDCKLPVGEYTLQAHWKVKPDDYPEKSLRIVSDIFEVN